jgi:CarboxypepD_reg-like domain
MNAKFQINIPSPCHEKWDEFTPTSSGGFCGSCQKNVIDFSTMSDSVLMAYFRDLPKQKNHLCGRFREDQLQKEYDVQSWFPTWTATDKTMHFDIPVTAFASKPRRLSLPIYQKLKMVRNITIAVLTLVFTESAFGQVSGQVIDDEGTPLPGVSIRIKGTTKGTASDNMGKYQLQASQTDTLEFSFIGFEPINLAVKDVKEPLIMKNNDVLLGELVVTGYIAEPRIFGKMAMGSAISFCKTENQTIEPSSELATKYASRIQVLGNPVVTNEVIIVPVLDPSLFFEDTQEKITIENWYAENGFQNVQKVEVYDIKGSIFRSNYEKIDDGNLKVNLEFVPNGICFIRVTYSNENSPIFVEKSAIRVMVNR